jgi:hypothetical protein
MAWPLSPAQARETGKEAGNALVTA